MLQGVSNPTQRVNSPGSPSRLARGQGWASQFPMSLRQAESDSSPAAKQLCFTQQLYHSIVNYPPVDGNSDFYFFLPPQTTLKYIHMIIFHRRGSPKSAASSRAFAFILSSYTTTWLPCCDPHCHQHYVRFHWLWTQKGTNCYQPSEFCPSDGHLVFILKASMAWIIPSVNYLYVLLWVRILTK